MHSSITKFIKDKISENIYIIFILWTFIEYILFELNDIIVKLQYILRKAILYLRLYYNVFILNKLFQKFLIIYFTFYNYSFS